MMHAKLFNAAPCEPSELKHKRKHRRAKLKSPLVCRKLKLKLVCFVEDEKVADRIRFK